MTSPPFPPPAGPHVPGSPSTPPPGPPGPPPPGSHPPPPSGPPPRPVGRLSAGRGPLVIACAAAAVALLSAVVALYAVGQASEARRQADLAVLAGGGSGQSTPKGDTRPPATTPARPAGTNSGTSTAGPTPTPLDVLNPTASYGIAYPPGQILNPQATTSSSAYIDLDEPRVGAAQDKADLSMSFGSNSSVPFFELHGDSRGALAPNAQMEAKACADLIRTGPLAEGVETAAQRGTNLCIATSLKAARAQGIKQRIVLIVVTALSPSGVPTVQVNAWEVPG